MRITNNNYWNDLMILFPISVGLLVRFAPVWLSDFPLNDGGMFYSITKQILENGFQLPHLISYNNLNLPFAYPPLGFYFAAFIQKVINGNLIELFRWIPVFWSCSTVFAFYFLANELFEDKHKASLATFVYATLFSAFFLVIAGGGITRGPGLVFSLISILFWIRFTKNSLNLEIIWSGLFFGLTILSHMEMTIFTALGVIWLSFFRKVHWKPLLYLGLVAISVSAGWWGIVLSRYGFQPFIAAWNSNIISNPGIEDLLILNFTSEPKITLWSVTGLLGCLWLIWNKKYFLPVWLLSILIFLKRGPETTASVIIALFSAEFLALGFRTTLAKRKNSVMVILIIIWVIIYILSVLTPPYLRVNTWMESVSLPDREAMAWVKQNTEPGKKFVVLSGLVEGMWGGDGVAEWFPVLADRESILTIQGTEWKKDEPIRRFLLGAGISRCLTKDIVCVDLINTKAFPEPFDYIYLTNNEICFQPGCVNLGIFEFYQLKNFTNVYQNDGVGIWQKK